MHYKQREAERSAYTPTQQHGLLLETEQNQNHIQYNTKKNPYKATAFMVTFCHPRQETWRRGQETVIEAIKQDSELNENSVNPDNLNRRYQICLFTSVVLCYSVCNRIPTDVNVILAKRIIIILFIISPFKAPCEITQAN